MEKQYTELGDEILYKNANLHKLGENELKDYYYFAVNAYVGEGCNYFGDVIALSQENIFFTELKSKYGDVSTAHWVGATLSLKGE